MQQQLQLVVRFLFAHGVFLNVVMDERSAKDAVNKWHKGELKGKVGDTFCPLPWCIDADQLVAVHCLPPEALGPPQQQQPEPPPSKFFGGFGRGTSGRDN